jgi:hypothetical protein
MDSWITLLDDDRILLRDIMRVVGFNQKELAVSAEVGETWLTNVLKGHRRTRVDRSRLERVANVLVERLNNRQADSRFPQERVQIALASLSRFTPEAAVLVPRKIHRPGTPVPVDSLPNIKRDEDNEALNALQDLPFTMMVAGPVQCGKSTLLARLQQKAREIGVESAWFDARPLASSNVHRTRNQADPNAATASALSELLQAQWGLIPSREGLPDSVPKLIHWLLQALAPTASKPRLLILDDLAKLGPRAVDDWLRLFVRKMDTRAITGVHLSIAIGLSHRFGMGFAHKLVEISSLVHWWPRIELGWFGSSEVAELERAITGTKSSNHDLWNLFKGQPYLTHAAALDAEFREAVRRWTATQTAAAARSIRKAEPYMQHLKAIKFAVLEPTLESDNRSAELVNTFVGACVGKPKLPMDHDQELFLKKARLLNRGGEPTLSIYRLIAEDLQKLIRE